MLNWPALRPVRQQQLAYCSTSKRVAVLAGRQAGKSTIAKRKLVRELARDGGGNYFYSLPTYGQAKRVAWKDINILIPKEWVQKKSETELSIETVFGSTLYILGMDKAQRSEGLAYRGGIVDECSDQKPGVIKKTFIPALSNEDSWIWCIGVPKSWGCGAKDYRAICEEGLKGGGEEGWVTYHWGSDALRSTEYVKSLRANLDDQAYKELGEAIWCGEGGGIFSAFKESVNVGRVEYDCTKQIVVGCDFNVNPMAWVLCHKYENELHQFGEIWLRHTTTKKALDYLWERFGEGHLGGWLFNGDATSNQRRTSASISDYVQICTDDRFVNKEVRFPTANRARRDRFASCNAMFLNANGEVRYRVDSSCIHTITDLKVRGYKEGTSEPDDSGDVGHISDALGYIIHYNWPSTLLLNGDTSEDEVISIPGRVEVF